VAARRLLTLRKYLDGTRHISPDVFALEKDKETRMSARLSKRSHDLQLTVPSAKNAKEGKLAAAQMRAMWNALDQATVNCTAKEFAERLRKGELLNQLLDKGLLRDAVGL
jgi:hypothetical protein